MTRKIIDLVHKKSQSMRKSPADAGRNTTMAIAAMKNGSGSPEWRAYMIQFVDQSSVGVPIDPRQLERLMGTDETKDDAEMDRKRAYLIGNSGCMDMTTGFLPFGVESIDLGLASDCAPTSPVSAPWVPQPPPDPSKPTKKRQPKKYASAKKR